MLRDGVSIKVSPSPILKSGVVGERRRVGQRAIKLEARLNEPLCISTNREEGKKRCRAQIAICVLLVVIGEMMMSRWCPVARALAL